MEEQQEDCGCEKHHTGCRCYESCKFCAKKGLEDWDRSWHRGKVW